MSETTFYTVLEAIRSEVEEEDATATVCSDTTDPKDILTAINRRAILFFQRLPRV
jgi:hypothetical protein